MTTHTVTFQPSGQTLEVEEGKALLTAAREAGIYIKSSCGGYATCADCVVKIMQGQDNLNTPPLDETKLIGNVFHITKERLSCQAMVTGPIEVDLSLHDKTTDAVKLNEKTKKNFTPPPKGSVRKRTKEEVAAIHEERHQNFKAKEEKRNSWQRHWEQDKDPTRMPGKGGNRRPKPFVIPEQEPKKDKEKDKDKE